MKTVNFSLIFNVLIILRNIWLCVKIWVFKEIYELCKPRTLTFEDYNIKMIEFGTFLLNTTIFYHFQWLFNKELNLNILKFKHCYNLIFWVIILWYNINLKVRFLCYSKKTNKQFYKISSKWICYQDQEDILISNWHTKVLSHLYQLLKHCMGNRIRLFLKWLWKPLSNKDYMGFFIIMIEKKPTIIIIYTLDKSPLHQGQ